MIQDRLAGLQPGAKVRVHSPVRRVGAGKWIGLATTLGASALLASKQCHTSTPLFSRGTATSHMGDGGVEWLPGSTFLVRGTQNMTLEQLEQRVRDLEQQVAVLRRELKPLRPMGSVVGTFGMFAEDPEFDEIVRLGREYRNQANSED